MTNTLGLPHKHYIWSLLRIEGVLAITDFHHQYHLVNNFKQFVRIPLEVEVSFHILHPLYDIINHKFDILSLHQQDKVHKQLIELLIVIVQQKKYMSELFKEKTSRNKE